MVNKRRAKLRYGQGPTDGRVCISILHAPGDDPLGYEKSSERWSPVQSVEKVLLSVMSMLAEPNTESPANVDAAKMWREARDEFKKIAHKHVRITLEEDPPSPPPLTHENSVR